MNCLPLALILLLASSPQAQSEEQQRPITLVITHATVIGAKGSQERTDTTVIMSGNRSQSLGKTGAVTLPKNAQVVDGTGKFLIPGLWDMHVHPNLLITDSKEDLALFLANGVTGVRQMNGSLSLRKQRNQIGDGALLEPRMVIGRVVDGLQPISSSFLRAADAVQGLEAVRKIKEEGYDFVEVYSRVPRNAYFGIAEEAKKQRFPFAGHVPLAVTSAEGSYAGQRSCEHGNDFLVACSNEPEKLMKEFAAVDQSYPNIDLPLFLRFIDNTLATYSDRNAATLFARLVKSDTWESPAMTIRGEFAFRDEPEFTKVGRLKYVDGRLRSFCPCLVKFWNQQFDLFRRKYEPSNYVWKKKLYRLFPSIVECMQKAGVNILAGTDSSAPYCFPGFGLHDEMELLVKEWHFTPREALQAAIINSAKFLGMQDSFGAVDKDKIADLLLLDANPITGIRNTTRNHAVIVNGKPLSRSTLQEMLDKVEEAYGKKKDSGKASPPEVQRLIDQLGSEDFIEREAASKRLDAIGEPAWNALRKAADISRDPEIRQRAQRLAEAIARRCFGEVRRFQGSGNGVSSVAFSPDGRLAVSGGGDPDGNDPTIRLWNVKTGKQVRRLEGHAAKIWGVAFSPADPKRILSCSEDKTVRLWNAQTGEELKRLQGHDRGVLAALFSADGKRVLSCGWDKTVRLWDLESGKELKRLVGHMDTVRAVAISPDGRLALSGGFDNSVRLWDLDSGQALKTLKGHTDMVHGVAFLSDGRQAVSCAFDKTIRIWDLVRGKESKAIPAHTMGIHGLALSPDGRRLLTASWDHTVRLWDVNTGKELHGFVGHMDRVHSVAFSPDGRYALSGSSDKTVRLWRLPKPDQAPAKALPSGQNQQDENGS